MTEPGAPLGAEIRHSLVAALRLARRDAGAMGGFNLTVPGFWRSFLSIVLAYPAFLVMAFCQRALFAAPPPTEPYLVWESVAYFGQGIAFPLAMIPLIRMLGLGATYVPFVIAYNWSGVLVTAILLPPLVLFGFGLIDPVVGALLNFAASIVSVYYRWVVTRIALATGSFTALGLVVIDMLLSIGIAMAIRPLYATTPA